MSSDGATGPDRVAPGPPVLQVRELSVRFPLREGRLRRRTRWLRAVDRVSLELRRGETLGLVGESGCGKSTLARAILSLVPAAGGSVKLAPAGAEANGPAEWCELTTLSPSALRQARRRIQMIFQDPYASLNPRMTVGDIISEPLRIHRLARGGELRSRVQRLMEEVGLDPLFIRRYPHEFSGGQRQRIGIARALALDPQILICDEPVSALDVSIRSQVLNLLIELQRRRGLSTVFIAHDLSVVKRISHRVAVMYLGRIVEIAEAEEIYREPLHPYTQALLSAIPIPDPEIEGRRRRILLRGDLPSAAEERRGCAFAGRCHRAAELGGRCERTLPELRARAGDHAAACLLYDSAPGPSARPTTSRSAPSPER